MSTFHVLVVDDEPDIRTLIKEILSDEGYKVTNAGNAQEARMARQKNKFDLILLDIWMPDIDGISLLREWSEQGNINCPIDIMSGHGTVDTAVKSTRLGAFDFVEKPLSIMKLLHTVERAIKSSKQSLSMMTLPSMNMSTTPVGRSSIMRVLRDKAQQYAEHDLPVLLIGEPGTGRSVLAHYICALSSRAKAPVVNLLAASLTERNAEVQLFGKEANGEIHNGYFEQAQSGTLIIDEFTDLNELAQKLILNVLTKNEFVRKDGHEPIKLQTRILATINSDYESRIKTGTLKRELLLKLNTLSLKVPPLRNHAEDVPELLSYYVDKFVDSKHLSFKRFGVAAQNRLRNYPWPGNIHELSNVVYNLLLTASDEEISLNEVEENIESITSHNDPFIKQDILSMTLREARDQFERHYLQQQLILCKGKVSKLSKRVGMERTNLYRKLRSLDINFKSLGIKDY